MLKRIKQYIDHKGVSVSAFEKSIGMSNASFGKSLKSGGAIGSDKLENILRIYPDINPYWLITGNGDMLLTTKLSEPAKRLSPLPLIPFGASAGILSGFDLGSIINDCPMYDVPDFSGRADFLIKVSGDSMTPRFSHGDTIACKKVTDHQHLQWNRAYVLDTDQGPLVKRVRKSEDQSYFLLESDNKNFEPFEIPRQSVRAMALVVGLIRVL